MDVGLVAEPPSTPRFCPPDHPPRVVEIPEADPAADQLHHDNMRRTLIDAVKVPNTTVLLGPNVVLDFTTAPDDDLPLTLAACVTILGTRSPQSLGALL